MKKLTNISIPDFVLKHKRVLSNHPQKKYKTIKIDHPLIKENTAWTCDVVHSDTKRLEAKLVYLGDLKSLKEHYHDEPIKEHHFARLITYMTDNDLELLIIKS